MDSMTQHKQNFKIFFEDDVNKLIEKPTMRFYLIQGERLLCRMNAHLGCKYCSADCGINSFVTQTVMKNDSLQSILGYFLTLFKVVAKSHRRIEILSFKWLIYS